MCSKNDKVFRPVDPMMLFLGNLFKKPDCNKDLLHRQNGHLSITNTMGGSDIIQVFNNMELVK